VNFTAQSSNIKLIELPPIVADELFRSGKVVIKGKANDEAVLCTSTHTFALKLAKTSNSLLVINQESEDNKENDSSKSNSSTKMDTDKIVESFLGEPEKPVQKQRTITANLSSYFELVEIKPKLNRLKELLAQHYFKGESYEDENLEEEITPIITTSSTDFMSPIMDTQQDQQMLERKQKVKYTLANLEQLIQGSTAEIRHELELLHGFEFNGFWRLLDPEYETLIFDLILSTVIEKGWSLEKINASECVQSLSSYSSHVVLQCLEIYGQPLDEFREYYCLYLKKVCLFRAEKTLFKQSQKWRLLDFIEAWRDCVPDECQGIIDIDLLKGVAINQFLGTEQFLMYFPLYNLAEDAKQRFIQLFAATPKWAFNDIEPYIKDLIGPKNTTEQLLLKYAHIIQENGAKLYSQRL